MRKFIAPLLLLAALPAFAHSGHAEQAVSFMDGFIHPLTGLDHMLAMFAVGLWSATTTRRIWLAPVSFAATLLIGALLAQGGLALTESMRLSRWPARLVMPRCGSSLLSTMLAP